MLGLVWFAWDWACFLGFALDLVGASGSMLELIFVGVGVIVGVGNIGVGAGVVMLVGASAAIRVGKGGMTDGSVDVDRLSCLWGYS